MAEESSPRPPSKRKPGVRKLKLPRPKMLDWRTHDLMAVERDDDSMVEELLTYQRNLDELLKHKGQYVLIKGNEIVGIYPTEFEAADDSARRFYPEQALIKQIVAKEPFHYFGYGLC